jgi:hypothetical protein
MPRSPKPVTNGINNPYVVEVAVGRNGLDFEFIKISPPIYDGLRIDANGGNLGVVGSWNGFICFAVRHNNKAGRGGGGVGIVPRNRSASCRIAARAVSQLATCTW